MADSRKLITDYRKQESPMAGAFSISIPSDNYELREEIEQELDKYARVEEAPRKFGIEEFRLIVELFGLAASYLTVVALLLDLRDRYRQRGKLSRVKITKGDVTIELDTADEKTLREFLEG